MVGYGIDLEVKLVDKRELDWKMYFDQSYLETGEPLDLGASQSRGHGAKSYHVAIRPAFCLERSGPS